MRDRSAPLTAADVGTLGWDRMNGLIPALVQDGSSGEVLMLAYMNPEALEATLASGLTISVTRSNRSTPCKDLSA